MTEVVGFGLVAVATINGTTWLLLVSLAIIVAGFSFMQPNLNSLLSRRTHPDQQGMILGVGQSVSSLARILGAGLGIPLLEIRMTMPYYVGSVLMIFGFILVVVAAVKGKDFQEYRETGDGPNRETGERSEP